MPFVADLRNRLVRQGGGGGELTPFLNPYLTAAFRYGFRRS